MPIARSGALNRLDLLSIFNVNRTKLISKLLTRTAENAALAETVTKISRQIQALADRVEKLLPESSVESAMAAYRDVIERYTRRFERITGGFQISDAPRNTLYVIFGRAPFVGLRLGVKSLILSRWLVQPFEGWAACSLAASADRCLHHAMGNGS